MPMPVSPRITAPGTQPPLGVTSKMLPSLSMIAMCVVSLTTPARILSERRSLAASEHAPAVAPLDTFAFQIRPLLHLRVVLQRIAGDERSSTRVFGSISAARSFA